jgi:DNA-binding NarL/FixJ family response regulator
MKDKPLHLLVIADAPDDVQLLEEAFLELDDLRFTRDWIRTVERVYAVAAQEALTLVNGNAFDAVVLDLNLGGGGSEAVETFQTLRDRAPELPVLVLAEAEEEALAMNLIRQGAQDLLLKFELDCLPLARALNCAVARQRLTEGRRAQLLVDELTGMWNDRGFAVIGQGQLGLAARCGLPVLVASAEGLAGEKTSELELIEAAEAFRAALPQSAVAARLSGSRFAAVVVPGSPIDAGNVECRLRGRMEVRWTTMHPQPGFEPAMQGALQSLCENVGVAARAGRHL